MSRPTIPGPVYVVIHVVLVKPEAGHVVDEVVVGLIVLHVGECFQLGLQELGNVEDYRGEVGGQNISQYSPGGAVAYFCNEKQ